MHRASSTSSDCIPSTSWLLAHGASNPKPLTISSGANVVTASSSSVAPSSLTASAFSAKRAQAALPLAGAPGVNWSSRGHQTLNITCHPSRHSLGCRVACRLAHTKEQHHALQTEQDASEGRRGICLWHSAHIAAADIGNAQCSLTAAMLEMTWPSDHTLVTFVATAISTSVTSSSSSALAFAAKRAQAAFPIAAAPSVFWSSRGRKPWLNTHTKYSLSYGLYS